MLRPLEHPSERWGTPPEIRDPLVAEFGFDLDAAADADLHVVPNYLTREDDALSGKEWPGTVVFCNPPYGRNMSAIEIVPIAGSWSRSCARWRGSRWPTARRSSG